jgi:ring-1,2-phenylacetyl-CoA epoxidase subunit PaaD
MTTIAAGDEQTVWDALQELTDPEIPAISIVDLGIVRSVELTDERVAVEIMPTFIACPAIGIIVEQVRERVREFAPVVDVRVTYAEQWTSERITERGRACLRAAGYAPPVSAPPPIDAEGKVFPLTLMPVVPCPFCDARNTRLENPFGPTLCRAIYYCPNCRQPFEHFKAV